MVLMSLSRQISRSWAHTRLRDGTEIPHKAEIFKELYSQWKDDSHGEIRKFAWVFYDGKTTGSPKKIISMNLYAVTADSTQKKQNWRDYIEKLTNL